MTKFLSLSFLILVSVSLIQCKSKYNDKIDKVLSAVDGDKRAALETLLTYYDKSQDTLKRNAAYFLIENFPENRYETIDKELFIESIDLAFEAWKKPWAKGLSFDEFKEYVLPVDLLRDSTGVFWRKRFAKEYAFVEDSIKFYPNDDPVMAACIIVNHAFKKKYTFEFDRDKTTKFDLNDWERRRKSDCGDLAYLTNNVMHAIGVPTAIDFTPQWANISFGHAWNVALINHQFIPFMGSEHPPGAYKVELVTEFDFIKKRTKVFRQLYKINTESLAYQTDEPIPTIFKNPRLVDVSKRYIPTQNVSVTMPDFVNEDFLYLCVVHLKQWKAVAWAKPRDGKVMFTDVRSGVMYAPGYFKYGELEPFDYPFILKKDGTKQIVKPQLDSREQVICLKKFPYDHSNLIKINDTYQLFFWHESRWQSLGSQVAKEKKLVFNNVPRQALLLLRDLTRGRQERVFTYQNGQQVF